MTLQRFSKLADSLVSERNHLVRCVAEDQEEVKKTKRKHFAALEAQKVLQAAAQQVQQMAHTQIATVVSRCLRAVFDDPYEFQIQFEQKRGKTEARLVFLKNGREYEPFGDMGGGVVDVAAFALRLACVMFSTKKRRRLIVLDEPFRFVHGEHYRERVRVMLETLAKDMGMQFIIVTGMEELRAGKVIELR